MIDGRKHEPQHEVTRPVARGEFVEEPRGYSCSFYSIHGSREDSVITMRTRLMLGALVTIILKGLINDSRKHPKALRKDIPVFEEWCVCRLSPMPEILQVMQSRVNKKPEVGHHLLNTVIDELVRKSVDGLIPIDINVREA